MSTPFLHIAIERCIACRACEAACAREHNNIPLIFVTALDHHYAVPLSCLQCEKSPCVAVCPTKALEKTSYSAVIIHQARCIGCKLCTMVCPLGVIQVGRENTMVKCDRCVNRLKQRKDPLCVLTCPTKALTYGTFAHTLEHQRKRAASKLTTSVKNLTRVKRT